METFLHVLSNGPLFFQIGRKGKVSSTTGHDVRVGGALLKGGCCRRPRRLGGGGRRFVFRSPASGCPRRQLYWCPQKWCSHYLAIVRGGRSARAPPRSTVTTRATSQVLSPHRGTLSLSILCPGSDLPHLTGVSDPAPPHRWLLISLKPAPRASHTNACRPPGARPLISHLHRRFFFLLFFPHISSNSIFQGVAGGSVRNLLCVTLCWCSGAAELLLSSISNFEMNGSQGVLVISRQTAGPPTRALPSLVPIAVAELGRRATQPQRHIPSVT